MPFSFFPCETIMGPVVVEPRSFDDNRGVFMETFKASDFTSHGMTRPFVQDNQSLSLGSVVRGLHFQLPPKAQGKLLRVLEGKVWDLVIDLRADSPTFLRWMAVELDDRDNRMFYIPPGFAHGFATLSERTTILYKCTAEYDSTCDTGIRWNDPALNIPWPVNNPQVSKKDSQLPLLDPTFFRGLTW